MVNCSIDTEKLLKNIITQFCDQNFKFTLNLKILGSIHVQVDNNEVLTCLLDEKYFKSAHNRLITTNQNIFNPHQQLSLKQLGDQTSNVNPALNLVTTLNQFQQQQQQQLKLVNPTNLVPSVKSQSLSSSSSTSSKSSNCSSSSSSYMSTDQNKHKRKRFSSVRSNGQKHSNDDASSSSSASSRSHRKENGANTDDDEDDDDASSENNENNNNNLQTNQNNLENEHEMNNDENLNTSSTVQTPVKRNKLDDNSEHNQTNDEAATAAATALSLISAAAAASKLYNQQTQQSNFQSITAHLNGFSNSQNDASESANASSSAVASSSSTTVQTQPSKPIKPKSKFIREQMTTNEQQLKQQIMQQSIDMVANQVLSVANLNSSSQTHTENIIDMNNQQQDDDDDASGDENGQLYMDEDNIKNEDENNPPNNLNNNSQNSLQDQLQLQQQQQQRLMMAAAAALMNNNSVINSNDTNANNLKLFMPHNLALNLAAVNQQQQQVQQMQQQQSGEKIKKKKQKANSLMSPSSASSSSSAASLKVPINGPNSTGSTTSSSSTSSTSSTKQSKKSRQTIAALAAAAAAARASTSATNPVNPLAQANQNIDLQRNLVALATQFGLKDSSNFDQIINEMNSNNEKAKLLATHTPKPAMSSKHIKKQHLLSASVNNSPNNISPAQVVKQPKTKKSAKANQNSHFQDSSNINQANPTVAAAAAAAAALQYHQFLNNNLNKGGTNSTPQKPNPKFHLANGGYVEDENNRVKYEDEDEYEPKGENYDDEEMKEAQSIANGPLSVKSLTQTQPLSQSNTNTPGMVNQNGQGNNLEFECTACEKKFKYYCYYKRHMDACHSEWPKYVCDTCNKSYKWEASFRQHLRSHHGQGGQPGQLGQGDEMNGVKSDQNGYHSEDEQNNENMMDENNENRRINESGLNESGHEIHDEMKENGQNDDDDEEDPDIDSQEQDIEAQINQSQNEPRMNFYERDNEQIGAAGTLASIAESLTGRLMINNHNFS